MRPVFKILLIPATLAFVPAISVAATAPPGNVPSEVQSDPGLTTAYHWRRDYYYGYHYRPYYRYHYRPYYRYHYRPYGHRFGHRHYRYY